MKSVWTLIVCSIVICLAMSEKTTSVSAAGGEAVLKASDITNKIFPDAVFFRGQVASVQMRNTDGVRYGDGMFLLAGMIDSSGYSSDIREKYQAYLISEVTLDLGGKKLGPGAYGVGFVQSKFVVMDLGAHDVAQVDASRDAEIKRPVPLQILSSGAKYRLYAGRDYVEFSRSE